VVLPSLDESSLRSHIACAAQDPWLFADTVAGNLRLAQLEATDEKLWKVLSVVGLEPTLRAWPEGLSTWVEEGGESLSGGQRRRLLLARALLRHAPITILDEPTEGLDDEAAQALVKAVRGHLAGKTLVWVSHRPIDRAGFEISLVLEDGLLNKSVLAP
jgi:ATP-binding cassette subfamily C protein CydC